MYISAFYHLHSVKRHFLNHTLDVEFNQLPRVTKSFSTSLLMASHFNQYLCFQLAWQGKIYPSDEEDRWRCNVRGCRQQKQHKSNTWLEALISPIQTSCHIHLLLEQ